MRVIVIGGAGFIGSHLVDALLARADEVHVVDDFSNGRRENLPDTIALHELDIRDDSLTPLVRELRPEVVFHLAAQVDVVKSVERPDFDADVNVVGTVRVLEAARSAHARVVFSSTGGAYGECERPALEADERRPVSPYATSKVAGEEYLATWNRLHGTRHVTCRLANVYGPRQRTTLEGGIVSIFLDRLRDGRETEIFGDGEQTRDFVYAGDVADALICAAIGPNGLLYNVGSGEATRIVELHRMCVDVAGVAQEPRFRDPRVGDLRHSALDPSLADRDLGWRPMTRLTEGIRRTWESLSN
jgi:UDP-glucose 4-epimerase